MMQRVALEAAIGFAKAEVGTRISWRAMIDRTSGPAAERLQPTRHALLAPLRHAGMPLIIGWGVLLLLAHGFAIWRSRQPTVAPTDAAIARMISGA